MKKVRPSPLAWALLGASLGTGACLAQDETALVIVTLTAPANVVIHGVTRIEVQVEQVPAERGTARSDRLQFQPPGGAPFTISESEQRTLGVQLEPAWGRVEISAQAIGADAAAVLGRGRGIAPIVVRKGSQQALSIVVRPNAPAFGLDGGSGSDSGGGDGIPAPDASAADASR